MALQHLSSSRGRAASSTSGRPCINGSSSTGFTLSTHVQSHKTGRTTHEFDGRRKCSSEDVTPLKCRARHQLSVGRPCAVSALERGTQHVRWLPCRSASATVRAASASLRCDAATCSQRRSTGWTRLRVGARRRGGRTALRCQGGQELRRRAHLLQAVRRRSGGWRDL